MHKMLIDEPPDLTKIGLHLSHYDLNRCQYTDDIGNNCRLAYDQVIEKWVVLLQKRSGWISNYITADSQKPTVEQVLAGLAYIGYAAAVKYLRNQKINNLLI